MSGQYGRPEKITSLSGDGAKQLSARVAETIENDLAAQYVLQLQNELGATVNSQAMASAIGVQPEQ